MDSKSIIDAVTSVTKGWAKQRKSEERNSQARSRREYYYSDRVNFSDIADKILPEAYKHASGNGQYTVSKRQMYYASREKFKEMTGRDIDASYFSQTILVQYLNRHNVDWKITADPRGTFVLPNTSHPVRIPVGTIAIEKYLNDRLSDDELDVGGIPIEWPSEREKERFAAVLYIEKEGFEPLLKEARIAERFDLAIMSCKGQSVAAARMLVDQVCGGENGVPLFIVHDFDKYGFEIAECLTTESESAQEQDRVAYHFENEIRSIDFGLRLEDVEKYKLASEGFKTKGKYYPLSMTKAEIAYMKSGKRVELNAFTAPQFVEWLEGKLKKHLPKRLVPSDDVLERAYRRGLVVSKINRAIDDINEEDHSDEAIPKALRKKVIAAMKSTGKAWDVALHEVIAEETDNE